MTLEGLGIAVLVLADLLLTGLLVVAGLILVLGLLLDVSDAVQWVRDRWNNREEKRK